MRPQSVLVHESDAPILSEVGVFYSFEEFEHLALLAANSPVPELNKTRITVYFDDGPDIELSFYLNIDNDLGFMDYVLNVLHDPNCRFASSDDQDVQIIVETFQQINFIQH